MSAAKLAAAVSMIESIYRRHAAGCCLHVVLDDGNYGCVQWCLDQPEICAECRECANVLLTMSKTQIRKAAYIGCERSNQPTPPSSAAEQCSERPQE